MRWPPENNHNVLQVLRLRRKMNLSSIRNLQAAGVN